MRQFQQRHNLFDTLHRYSMVVGILSCLLHVAFDGLASLPLLVAVSYLMCAHYGCSSRNRFSITYIREVWAKAKTKTLLRVFSMTELCLLRIVFLSLHESKVDDTITVFLAYVQLLIAFTDNLSLCCELEESRSSRRRGLRWNERPQAAAAA
ncbi:unnamed protein product [Cylicocyclus nassatus]|uniref:Uncharacterized protein n=1 Tax=Cylicocyclus nassatus TaxID=53992 RepID=A0AA36HA80_CYLNA|nr:unnamed protein product [Cylicocyclus nassatus]